MTFICFKNILTTVLLTVLTQTVFARTWSAALPYTQQMDGQNVVVKAISYEPYRGSPMLGVTKVYFKNKLLYSIDKYYREKIFTSNDGQYLIVVNTSNAIGVSSFSSFGNEQMDFNQTAIEVFKNGQPFKMFMLGEVVDTTRLANNGQLFNWGYSVDIEAFREAEFGCESCIEVYGKKILRTGDTSEIDNDEWEECKRECDSVKLKEIEMKVFENSIYVQGNSLFVLTNQNVVVKLDFAEMAVQKIPFDKVVENKETFHAPKLNRKYKKVKLPEKFDEPNLKDGRSFEKGVADLFGFTIPNSEKKERLGIYIRHLVIDRYGKCVDFDGEVSVIGTSKYLSPNDEMTEKLNIWLKEQTFETKLIPKGFDRYSFLCIVDLPIFTKKPKTKKG